MTDDRAAARRHSGCMRCCAPQCKCDPDTAAAWSRLTRLPAGPNPNPSGARP